MSPQGDPARNVELTSEQLARIWADVKAGADRAEAWASLSDDDRFTLYSVLLDENAQLRQQRDGLVTALRNICDDACGERRDPLWIVKRELIYAGSAALAGVETPPQEGQ